MSKPLIIICAFIAALAILQGTSSQESSTFHPRKIHHHRSHHRRQNETKSGRELATSSSGDEVKLHDKDKYYEDEDEYATYDDGDLSAENDTSTDDEDEDKFIESTPGIILDHVDFVLLRLKHISMRTTSNVTELLAMQQEEFKVNTHYKQGWDTAVRIFNDSKREAIFNNTTPDSATQTVPVEYHIAIVAYTLGSPSMYYYFNKDTREVCSGNDIDSYQWKSYFKLLQLAIETLGSREERWRDSNRFLYRGASSEYELKEGQVLAFQHFISTSAALTSAENFAGKSLFEFEGFYNGTAMKIWDHSFYEHEMEVLFSPVQVFKVDSIHVGTHYTRYVLVKHDISVSGPCPCDQQTTRGYSYDTDTMGNSLRVYSSSSGVWSNVPGYGKILSVMALLLSCRISQFA